MIPNFSPEFVKEKLKELDDKYYIQDIGLTGYEWFIRGALQKIEELQTKLEYKPDRVRCTADGDYPLNGDEVIFQCEGRKSYIGYFTIQDNENVFIVNYGYAYWASNETIYWTLYTSLKEQYERQKEEG